MALLENTPATIPNISHDLNFPFSMRQFGFGKALFGQNKLHRNDPRVLFGGGNGPL